jgi:hypothetical protein
VIKDSDVDQTQSVALWEGKHNGKERRISVERTLILGFPLRINLTHGGQRAGRQERPLKELDYPVSSAIRGYRLE